MQSRRIRSKCSSVTQRESWVAFAWSRVWGGPDLPLKRTCESPNGFWGSSAEDPLRARGPHQNSLTYVGVSSVNNFSRDHWRSLVRISAILSFSVIVGPSGSCVGSAPLRLTTFIVGGLDKLGSS